MSTIKFLESKNLILKPIEVSQIGELAETIEKWVNDGLVTHFMFTGQKPMNKEQVAKDLHKQIEEEKDIVFLVLEKQSNQPIGFAGLYEIHQTARKAEFRILIGEKDFWGRGLGTEITELIVFYGFDRLNLNRIYLGFTADNQAAGRAYQKAGFLDEGILKQDIYRNSQYYDSARMAILRDDYYQKFYEQHKQRFSAKV